MNLKVMRLSYLLAWVSAVVAVILKGAAIAHVNFAFGLSARGTLMFSGLMFVATVASSAYESVQHSPEAKGKAAAA